MMDACASVRWVMSYLFVTWQSLHVICQERTGLKRCRCMSSMIYEVLMIPLTVQPANLDCYAEKGWWLRNLGGRLVVGARRLGADPRQRMVVVVGGGTPTRSET